MAVVPQDAIAFSVKANALNNPHVAIQTPSSPHQPAAEYPLQTFQRSNFVRCLFAALWLDQDGLKYREEAGAGFWQLC